MQKHVVQTRRIHKSSNILATPCFRERHILHDRLSLLISLHLLGDAAINDTPPVADPKMFRQPFFNLSFPILSLQYNAIREIST